MDPGEEYLPPAMPSPFGFLMSHGGFRGEPPGALRLGAVHGLYCLGCCWALMALLFVGGVMNILGSPASQSSSC